MSTVSDVMTTSVKSLQSTQVLLEAMQFLRQHEVRHIPIMEGTKLVGVLTDRDVKRATPSALDPGQREVWERIVKDTTLAKVMSRDPMTVSRELTFKEAVKLFVEERIGCLPVIEDGELVGIVTASDLFRGMLVELEG